MKHVIDALDDAAAITASKLTAGIRRTATESGWAPHVANSLSVVYQEGKFDVSVPPEHEDEAWKSEYGSETRRPTAVLRKYQHGNADSKAFFSTLNHVVGSKNK